MDTAIVPLAESRGIRAGETLDVMLGEGDEPMIRTLQVVRTKREYGKDWLILEWDAKGMTPWGTQDCGFSGWVVDDDLRERITLMASNNPIALTAPTAWR